MNKSITIPDHTNLDFNIFSLNYGSTNNPFTVMQDIACAGADCVNVRCDACIYYRDNLKEFTEKMVEILNEKN